MALRAARHAGSDMPARGHAVRHRPRRLARAPRQRSHAVPARVPGPAHRSAFRGSLDAPAHRQHRPLRPSPATIAAGEVQPAPRTGSRAQARRRRQVRDARCERPALPAGQRPGAPTGSCGPGGPAVPHERTPAVPGSHRRTLPSVRRARPVFVPRSAPSASPRRRRCFLASTGTAAMQSRE